MAHDMRRCSSVCEGSTTSSQSTVLRTGIVSGASIASMIASPGEFEVGTASRPAFNISVMVFKMLRAAE